MLHLGELDQLGSDLIGRPAFGGERSVPGHAGAGGHEFLLDLAHRFRHLGGDAGADAGEAEEDAIEVAARGSVGEGEGADEAVAAELEEEFPSPAEKKEDEDDVAKTVDNLLGFCCFSAVYR